MMHKKKDRSRALIHPMSTLFHFWKKNRYPMMRAGTLTASAPVLCSSLMTTNPISGLLGFGIFFLLWGFAVSVCSGKK